jgi:hypothetical protein
MPFNISHTVTNDAELIRQATLLAAEVRATQISTRRPARGRRGVRVCAKTVIGVTAAPMSEYFIVIIVITGGQICELFSCRCEWI